MILLNNDCSNRYLTKILGSLGLNKGQTHKVFVVALSCEKGVLKWFHGKKGKCQYSQLFPQDDTHGIIDLFSCIEFNMLFMRP